MRDVLVAELLLSLNHAMKILRLFKQKKHANQGFFFELTDLGVSIHHRSIAEMFPHLCAGRRDLPRQYADYPGRTDGYHLKVYRTIP